MKNVVYGCACALLLASTLTVLDLRTTVLELRTDLSLTAANLAAVSSSFTRTADTQNLYWKAASLQTSRLIGSTRHSVEKFDDLVDSTNNSLNNPDRGLLPTLAFEIHQNGRAANDLMANTDASVNGDDGLLHLFGTETITLTAKGAAALGEATEVLHNTDRATKAVAVGMEQAAPEAVGTLKDIHATTGSVAHVADHYDHKLTDKETRWQQIKSNLWFAARVAVRAW